MKRRPTRLATRESKPHTLADIALDVQLNEEQARAMLSNWALGYAGAFLNDKEVEVLGCLVANAGHNPREDTYLRLTCYKVRIAEATGLNPGQVARALRELERIGLLVAYPDREKPQGARWPPTTFVLCPGSLYSLAAESGG